MPDDDHRARVRLAEACQRWSDDVARTHRIHVEERDFMPPGVVAFATPSERTVVVPPFSAALSEAVLLARLATRAHEFGHVIRGQCPGTWPHHGIMVKSWHNCLSCEIGAWNAAMGLISFGREMHQHLKRSLAIYRRDTPAPRAALDASRQLASDTTFARRVLARLDRDRRLDALEEMRRIAAEARRPRLKTDVERRLEKHYEMQRYIERMQHAR